MAGILIAHLFDDQPVAKAELRLVGSRSKIVHGPLENDPKQRQPDISLAQELLGWKLRVALKLGLTSTVAYLERRSPTKFSGLSSSEKPLSTRVKSAGRIDHGGVAGFQAGPGAFPRTRALSQTSNRADNVFDCRCSPRLRKVP